MKRRYRLLAFALMASALCVLPATASAAPGFVASKYPATVNATPVSSQFTLAYGQFNCDAPSMDGVLAASSNSLPVNVANSTCTTFSSTLPMEMNGCRFVLNAASSFDIGPNGCGPIKVNMFGCQATIPAQSGLAATFEETGQGTVRFKANTSSLKYSQKGTGCKSGTHTNGKYSGEWILQVAGATLQVEDIALGVYLAGAQSGEPAAQPRIEAEKNPTRLVGESPLYGFEFRGTSGGFTCDFTFEEVLTQATASFAPEVSGSNCLADFFNATVDMNTCGFTFAIDNVGPPYEGTMDIDCVTPGDVIEVQGGPCRTKIGEQSGLGGIDLANVGEGAERGFETEFAVKDVSYTREKLNFLCPRPAGSFTDGEFVGELAWRGLK